MFVPDQLFSIQYMRWRTLSSSGPGFSYKPWSPDMTETLLSRSLRRLFAGGGAIGPILLAQLLVQPQAAAQEAAARPVQRVIVTGSNIRRAEAETASSVLTVNRADIERSGKSTVTELLQTLAVDNQGSVPTSFGNGFAAGASGISLRGLGTASTLVLLNGRRMAPYGLADDGQKVFTDLNVIPLDAVDRIEILKDGASAIYGSDAIAGVVNIILRRDFKGTTVRGSLGISEEWDGEEQNFAITHGIGDLESNGYNALFNFEFKRKNDVWLRDRADREQIGRIDLRPWGFSAQEALGGTGAITGPNAAGSAINGNVRNPATNNYYNRGSLDPAAGFTRSFPGAACANFTSQPQGDPGGGCLIDSPLVYNQIQPQQENYSLFGRGTWRLAPAIEAYAEWNLYSSKTNTSTTPSTVSANVGFPGGPVSNAAVQLGPNHPDNPYFGSAARLRYLAGDVGPRQATIDGFFVRGLAGVKGNFAGWDVDTSVLFSRSTVTNERSGFLQRDVAFALLDPSPQNLAAALGNSAAYAALPLGTFWRIAENAGLNDPAVYAALSPRIASDSATKIIQGDLKATREFGKLAGGAIGVAAGAELAARGNRARPPPAPSAATSSASATRPTAARATCSRCMPRRWRPCSLAWKSPARCAGTTLPTSATPGRRRSASSGRRRASSPCAAASRAASVPRARPRTASAAWPPSRPRPTRCAAASASQAACNPARWHSSPRPTPTSSPERSRQL
jgi:iron complex outermembrane receptor protein